MRREGAGGPHLGRRVELDIDARYHRDRPAHLSPGLIVEPEDCLRPGRRFRTIGRAFRQLARPDEVGPIERVAVGERADHVAGSMLWPGIQVTVPGRPEKVW